MDKYVCDQDLREKELLEQGYVEADRVFFRLGRAIFVVDTLAKDFTEREALGTPLGLAAKINDPGFDFDKEKLDLLQNIFGSTEFLRISIEGDPDSGIRLGPNEVLLTGYRFGLDDVIIDGKLFETTHSGHERVMRNFADWIEQKKWNTRVPNWESYDGMGYRMKESPELEEQLMNVVRDIRALADTMEHKDDKPDYIKEKFRNKSRKVGRNGAHDR